jgi:hypothetical protein
MSYVVEILNTSDNATWTKVAQLGAGECTCKVNRRINEDWVIDLTYSVPPLGQGMDKSAYLISWNARLRVSSLDDSTDVQTFLVTKTSIQKSVGGTMSLSVTGLHVAIVSMQNKVIDAEYDFQNMTPLQILTVLLANHSWGWCSVVASSITEKLSLKIGWETVASALQKTLDACRGEVDFTESSTTMTIYPVDGMGSALKYIHIRPERNMKALSLQKYCRDAVNKVFGVGGGNPAATIAGARHPAYSVVGQVVTVDHAKLVPENDSWNGYKAKFATGMLAGSSFAVADCAHGAVRDTLTLTGTLTGAAAGDKIVITDSSGVEVDYLRAGASIASYGQIEAVYLNSEHGNAVNLVEKPFLDDAYTGGLCAGWTKNGSPTCSENTNAAYIQYSAKSQKVIGAADGDGVYQEVAGLTAGKYYRIKANIWLEGSTPASAINVYLGTDDAIPVSSSEIESEAAGRWVSIDVYGIMDASYFSGGTVRISIVQIGAQAATFYVDAIQISECPTEIGQNLTANCESLDLWKEVFDYLVQRKEPLIEYKCNFVDLNRIDPLSYPNERINLGDTVLVTDRDLGISGVSARVNEVSIDPFRPELTEHTVSNI